MSSFENTLRKKFGFLQRPISFVHPVEQCCVEEYTSLMLSDHNLSALSTSSLTNHHGNPTSKCQNHQKKSDHDDNTGSRPITQLSMDRTQLLEDRLKSLEEIVQHSHRQAENDRNCIDELQRQLQLMELMLKAYYIGPEVFISLNNSYTADDNTTIVQEQFNSDADNDIPKSSSFLSNNVGRSLHARLTTTWRRRFRNNNNHSHSSLTGARKTSINTGRQSSIINEEIRIDNGSGREHVGHYGSDSNQERVPSVKKK